MKYWQQVVPYWAMHLQCLSKSHNTHSSPSNLLVLCAQLRFHLPSFRLASYPSARHVLPILCICHSKSLQSLPQVSTVLYQLPSIIKVHNLNVFVLSKSLNFLLACSPPFTLLCFRQALCVFISLLLGAIDLLC